MSRRAGTGVMLFSLRNERLCMVFIATGLDPWEYLVCETWGWVNGQVEDLGGSGARLGTVNFVLL